ncbi:hypothetical protein GCM10027436_67410 [Actinophytocola sediminis]
MVCQPSRVSGPVEGDELAGPDLGGADEDGAVALELGAATGVPPLFRVTNTIVTTAPTMSTIANTPKIIGSLDRAGGGGG